MSDDEQRRGGGFEATLEASKGASVGHLLIRAGRLSNEQGLSRLQGEMGGAGVRLPHLSLMPHIALEGTRISELAQALGVSKQAVGQLVDDLEGWGMVARVRDPEDGRAKRVIFTEAGRAGLLKGLGVLATIDDDLADALGAEALEQLRLTLLKVVAHFEGGS